MMRLNLNVRSCRVGWRDRAEGEPELGHRACKLLLEGAVVVDLWAIGVSPVCQFRPAPDVSFGSGFADAEAPAAGLGLPLCNHRGRPELDLPLAHAA
jgi:hypothetical protein